MWRTFVTLSIVSLAFVTHVFGNGSYFVLIKTYMKHLN